MEELTIALQEGHDLARDDVRAAAAELLGDTERDAAKAAFLRALADKGETPGEVAAFVEAFLERAVEPGINPEDLPGPMIDVCGTGGDKLDLFNVSTTSIFVIAAGGLSVVKHGNRGITSKSGGADVLEALGVRIDLPPGQAAQCVREAGVCFFFAPLYHPAFKAVAPVRQMLAKEGRRSVFNLLGPLLNPARPSHQLIGVADASLTKMFAEILTTLGRERAWVVHGTTADGRGMDELSTVGGNEIAETAGGLIKMSKLDPGAYGFSPATLEDLRGGDAVENAGILQGILSGADRGPRRVFVILNAAAGLVVGGKAGDVAEGIALAGEAIDSGAATKRLEMLRALSH